jgi:hypothetical protein
MQTNAQWVAYTAKGTAFQEVIVDYTTGKIRGSRHPVKGALIRRLRISRFRKAPMS